MWSYLQFEWQQFISNKKNLIIIFFLILGSSYYGFFYGRDYQPIETVNVSELKTNINNREDYLNDNKKKDAFFNTAYSDLVTLEKARLHAVKKENWSVYAKETAKWYEVSNALITYGPENAFFYKQEYYKYGEAFPKLEGKYAYFMHSTRLDSYVEKNLPLSKQAIEETTALQHIEKLFHNILPYVLLLTALFFIADIVTKDYQHRSIVQAFPISLMERLICKYIITMASLLLSFLSITVIIGIGIGIKNGIGSFNLSVPVFSQSNFFKDSFGQQTYIITLGNFLIRNLLLILLNSTIIFWLSAILSLLFKNEGINVFSGFMYIFLDRSYYGRGKGAFVDYSYLPFSYIQSGKVLSGYNNFFYESNLYTLQRGSLVLSVVALTLIFICFICTKVKKIRTAI